jgi:hypothetical protein
VGSEHPLKQAVDGFPQASPIQPRTVHPVTTLKVFLLYAPGFPGIPPPQQAIIPPLPPAPHTSKTTCPADGAVQHTHANCLVRTFGSANIQICPFSRFISVSAILLNLLVTKFLNDVGIINSQ